MSSRVGRVCRECVRVWGHGRRPRAGREWSAGNRYSGGPENYSAMLNMKELWYV